MVQAETATDLRALEKGRAIAAVLSANQSQDYRIDLVSGQYALIVLTIPCHELSIVVSTPSGATLANRKPTCDPIVSISVLSSEPGSYDLSVRSRENRATKYELELKELRTAVPGDPKRISGETAVAEADELMEKGTADAVHGAIKEYEEALQDWRAVGLESEFSATLRKTGTAYLLLGEHEKALTLYNRALTLSRQRKNRSEIAESLNAISHLYFSLGENKKALESAVNALTSSHSGANRDVEAQALANIGEAYSGIGKLQEAVDHYQRALSLWTDSGNLGGQAQALTYLGFASSDLSNTDEALSLYHKALELWKLLGNHRGEAQTLTALGHLHSKIGEKQLALDFYREAMQLIAPMGDRQAQAVLLNGMGYVYDQMGSKNEAIDYYRRALLIFQDLNDRWGACLAILAIGRDLHSLGEREQALHDLQLALSAAHNLGKTRLESHILRDIGLIYESTGTADQALSYYNRSIALARKGEDRRDTAYTFNNIGRVLENQQRSPEASSYYDRALSLNRESGDRFGEADTLYNIARVERNLGKLDNARAHSERALTIVEGLRTKVISQELRSSYAATAHQQYELLVSILTRLNKEKPNNEFAVLALEASERGRARSLLESLKEAGEDIRGGVDPALLKREQSLEEELDLTARRYGQSGDSKNEKAQALAKEITQLTTLYNEVRAEIRARSPRYAALTQPHPLSVAEIQQQLLDNNTLLLEYMLGEERSYAWVVTTTEVSSYELPGRAQIEVEARRLYELLSAQQPKPGETSEQRLARERDAEARMPSQIALLSKLLLAPVADKLGTKRLLIVPDGALQYIPFQALTAAGRRDSSNSVASATSDEQVPLVVNHEIVNEPSASALALVLSESAGRKAPPKSVAILADPVFEEDDSRLKSDNPSALVAARQSPSGEITRALRDVGVGSNEIPRLLSSREEADAIMSVVPWRTGFKAVDFDANRTTAMGANLGQYRVVHFATHALLDNEHPELSGIVLSLVDEKGQRQDGFLRLHDIYNLKLPVDLVVLSACQTGLGKDVKGEGLIGLTRGFMYAGASGVVASLWKVDDEATAELMKHFYEGMFEKGMSPSAALRAAQLTMRQEKRWQEPYYWAGFVIQGQYAGNGPKGYQLTPAVKVAGLGFVALGLSLSVFFVLWQRRRRNL